MKASFTDNMVKHILKTELSSGRFEQFCCNLFSKIDGCTYVTTSWNYDQGRDGRTTTLRKAQHPPVICVSLRDNAEKKAIEDAEKLSKKPFIPKEVRFCTTQDATENLLDKIKQVFITKIKGLNTVLADGIIQISQLAVQYPEIFERYYLAELKNLKDALSIQSGESDKVQITGMRIALTTQFSEDARQIRDDLQKNLILSELSGGNKTLEKICQDVTASLHLPYLLQTSCLHHSLQKLYETGLIVENHRVYNITEDGKKELKKRTEDGTEILVNGQQMFRDILQELTGEQIEQGNFTCIWAIVQDEIANMFLTNGIYLFRSIQSIITNSSVVAEEHDLHISIQQLAKRVADLNLWGNRKEEVYQAITDIFHEVGSKAFKWLTQLGTIYVSLCSLGLESTAQQQLEDRLSMLDLLLDTDIILSFLSPAESKHTAIEEVVRTWQRINGHIYVTPCVLEESAYHAWIAEPEYNNIWRDLPKYNDQAAQRLISNAFIRGFRVECGGKYDSKHWGYYIQQFRGQTPYDYIKIEALLKDAYIFKTSDEYIDPTLADHVKDNLIKLTINGGVPAEEINSEELDKYRRDGLLISVLMQHRKRESNRSALVVSSSAKLSEACKNLKIKLGPLEPVAPIGAVAYLLTMIPGVNMNMGTLRGLLFDTGYSWRVKGIERVALRMIQASDEYLIPFARRPTLRRKLDEKIGEMATQLGLPKKQIADDLEQGRLRPEYSSHILAESVDQLVQSRSEKKIQDLEEEIKRLQSRK